MSLEKWDKSMRIGEDLKEWEKIAVEKDDLSEWTKQRRSWMEKKWENSGRQLVGEEEYVEKMEDRNKQKEEGEHN